MAANRHGMTPLSPAQESPSDTTATAIKAQVAMIENTLNLFEPIFNMLEHQSEEVSKLTLTMIGTTKSIEDLHGQILSQDTRSNQHIEKVKRAVAGKIRSQIMDNMKPQIQKKIKAEINLQVSEQVTLQIRDHLPVSLEDQVAESKREVAEMTSSLVNSEARRVNSILRFPSGYDEPLTPVLKSSGQNNNFFPPNLKTLFLYDLEKSKSLVRDYGLLVSDIREENFNKFMSFIGIQHSLQVFSS
jgi:hypothetical protein